MPPDTKKNWALMSYVGLVVVVFAALVISLFHNEAQVEVDDELLQDKLEVSDSELAAIIEEYNNETSSDAVVSADKLIDSAPEPIDPAWTTFAATWREESKPKIAIIIDDLGLDESVTEQISLLQAPLTLAYLPYADNLRAQTNHVRRAGHELMVHLPMQSQRTTADPGTNALLLDLPFDEFARRLEWNLSRFDGFVGINNHMGSKLTENPGLMVRVMARLKRDGYLFVDSLTTPDSVGARAAHATNVPYIKRDIFLDNERDPNYIRTQLAAVERIARLRGYAIAIGHPYPETLSVLEDWLKTLKFKGVTLVPISQIIHETNENTD